MRKLLGIYGDEKVQKAYKEKIKELQAGGSVPSSFESVLDGKEIKLNLPNDVRQQYKEVILAEEFVMQDVINESSEKIYDLRMTIFECARKNMLYDKKEVKDIRELPFEMIDTVVMMYVMELLLPLYHRSSTIVSERVKTTLKTYITG